MAASGTGKCLGWPYTVLLLLLAAQTSTQKIVFHFSHQGASTTPPGWFLVPYHNYKLSGGNFCASAKVALKHSEMVYLLCKFRSCAHNPWLVIVH